MTLTQLISSASIVSKHWKPMFRLDMWKWTSVVGLISVF